jgi:putative transposase
MYLTMNEDGSMAEGALMAKKGKHSKAEIAAKLAQADDLATQGKLQSEIARTLGVSVITLHRWRRKSLPGAAPAALTELSQRDPAPHARIAELQLENSRLRRLVTDFLLEKLKREEALQASCQRARGPPP